MRAPDSLGAAYDACRAIVRAHAKTFFWSASFLPPARRRAIHAVYAFCRIADDIADAAQPEAVRLAELAALEAKLRQAYAGAPEGPIFVAYADAAARFALPLEPALDLLRGVRRDVTVRRYATFAELHDYCYLVASTVGVLTAPIFGTRDPAALPYAIELGRAMQLTNILRDVGEDAARDRIYLPADEMARFAYGEDDLFAGVVDARFAALMAFQIARARRIYVEAEPGIDRLPPQSRYTVRLARRLYARILDAIEANDYDVFRRRAYVPARAKASVALATALRR